MPSDVTRKEFDHLAGRVDGVERGLQDRRAMMRQILADTRRQGDDLAALRVEMKDVRTDVKGVRGEIKEMRGEMTGMHRELTDVRTEVKGIRGGIKEMGGEMTDIRGELTDLKGRVGRVEAKVDGLTKNLPKIVGGAMRKALREREKKS